ncbi:MAG TPA: diaminopimelate epimerase [Pirellulales bacterium]|jgi:diaminopimelate epimerase|nr:diaminopimelate epimerase [Pirellulales bacterium]
MRFTKMHGIGNDYVYVDCFAQPPPADPAAVARRISDRHFGVGSDGLILICPAEHADAKMRMFNADGSESEMCGNGVRCVAKFVHDHGIATKPELKIETGRGILSLALEVRGGLAERIKVDMGEPILEPAKIPVALAAVSEKRVVNFPLDQEATARLQRAAGAEQAGVEARMTCMSMGNPHLILFCREVEQVDLSDLGPYFERAALFPKRINVHFVQVHSPHEVTMRTWERGSGVTLACGTGACAVCVAGALTERTERRVLAHLPGGDLELDWAADNHVLMTGTATEVFTGEWNG